MLHLLVYIDPSIVNAPMMCGVWRASSPAQRMDCLIEMRRALVEPVVLFSLDFPEIGATLRIADANGIDRKGCYVEPDFISMD